MNITFILHKICQCVDIYIYMCTGICICMCVSICTQEHELVISKVPSIKAAKYEDLTQCF